MASEPPESSRAGEEAAQRMEAAEVARQQRRPWVALSAIPVVHGADDAAEGEAVAVGTVDVLLELRDPPRASYLNLPERFVPDPRRRDLGELACVVSTAPGCVLVRYTQGRDLVGAEYFLCNVRTGTVTCLPDVPAVLAIKLAPDQPMGIVADPRRAGEYFVLQLHPTPMASTRRHDALLCYSTATAEWVVKPLAAAPDHEPWVAHRVFAHGGLLFSLDCSYVMLVCDPFEDHPHLRLVQLPPGCKTFGDIDRSRCIRPSEGMIRYIEIQGLSYDDDQAAMNEPRFSMRTLVDPAGPNCRWRLDYEVSFADVWANDTYIAAGLPQEKVPSLAFIDPERHEVVYFFNGMILFGWDVVEERVLACKEYVVDRLLQDPDLQCPGLVHAWKWEVPPKPCSDAVRTRTNGAGDEHASFGRGVEGFRRNIIRINAPNPLLMLRTAPTPAPAQPQPRGNDQRTKLKQSIRRVDQKIREAVTASPKNVHKLGRGRNQLKLLLDRADATEDQH